MKRQCLTCGKPTSGSYCRAHDPAMHRSQDDRFPRTNEERKRRKQAVTEHIATRGYICPGYGRGPHRATNLTADHVVPQALGGQGGRLRVLCRRCNSRRGARM